MKFKVLIDDTNLLVISKPKGIEYHGEDGIVQLLRREFPDIIGVHRLDRETSGILIFARNKETAQLSFFHRLPTWIIREIELISIKIQPQKGALMTYEFLDSHTDHIKQKLLDYWLQEKSNEA